MIVLTVVSYTQTVEYHYSDVETITAGEVMEDILGSGFPRLMATLGILLQRNGTYLQLNDHVFDSDVIEIFEIFENVFSSEMICDVSISTYDELAQNQMHPRLLL